MDREEKERIENEKEIDGTIESSLKYKNYDKINLKMLKKIQRTMILQVQVNQVIRVAHQKVLVIHQVKNMKMYP